MASFEHVMCASEDKSISTIALFEVPNNTVLSWDRAFKQEI